MNPFYTILTNYGKTALAEALAAQKPLEIPHMAAGDGGGAYYEPVEEQTHLRNERWRGALNDLRTDTDIQGQVIAEAIIPMGIEGDWTVREIGLFDMKGGLIAVGKYPENYIPSALSGAKSQVHISIIIKVDNVAAVQLIVDHGQVLASKLYVQEITENNRVPDATLSIKGKVQLADDLGDSQSLVLHQEAISKIFRSQERDITKSNTLLPASFISTVNKRIGIEVVNNDAASGKGEVNIYRATKHGWWLRERIVTGGYSGGASLPDNKCPVWRLGQLFICPHLLTLKQTISRRNEAVGEIYFTPDQFTAGDNKNTIKFYQLGGNVGQYIEFITNTKSGDINILFAATANTARTMTVEFYDDSILIDSATIKTIGKGGAGEFNTYVTSVKNPRPGSQLTVRIAKADAYYAYIAGINANFDTCISDDIDKIYWSLFNKTQLIRPTQVGAMCYVFKESASDVFGGESHGGETPALQKFLIDNKESTLTTGSMFSCESFRVIQETQIKWSETKKIDCFTEHRFNADGTHEFIGSFNPSDGFTTHIAYCPMFTVDSNYFRRLTFPESLKMDSYPNGSSVTFEYPINKFEIQGRDNAYTAGIIWSSSLKNNSISNLLVKPYSDNSTKLYSGPAINKTMTLEPFSIHQLRYYF